MAQAAFASNTNVGTATIEITGKGNYSGTVTGTFAITQKSISETATLVGTQGDNGWYTSDVSITQRLTTSTSYTVNVEVGAFVDHVNLSSPAISGSFTTADVDLLLVAFNHIGNGTIAVTNNGNLITSGTGVTSGAALVLSMTPDTGWQSGTLTVKGINQYKPIDAFYLIALLV